MGLRQFLADAPSSIGATADPGDPAWNQVEAYLQRRYVRNEEEAKRKAAAKMRQTLYDCKGIDQVLAVIDQWFRDPMVRKLRKDVAPYANFNNTIRRVTDERSRVYAKPPRTREVRNETNDRYQELQRITSHNRAMQLANRWTTLKNDTLWMFRVRQTPTGQRVPRIDIIGPENFCAIEHPLDKTLPIGFILDQTPSDPRANPALPHYLVWTDDEVFKLDRAGRIVRETIEPNGIGRIPGILVSSGYRASSILDPDTGEDMVGGHLAQWLIATNMLKESKSLSRQAAFTGETGQSATGQSQDSEADLLLAEGVSISTVDRGGDLRSYMEASDHIVERLGANYGIPPDILRHKGATSGHEIELRRIPLEEIREDQIAIFREAERNFAEVQATVLAADMPELAFSTEGWHIDFAEIKRPVEQAELYDVRRVMRSMGHSDPIIEAMEDNPEFDEQMATEWVAERMTAQAAFIDAARTRRNEPEGADMDNPGQSPGDNGARTGQDASEGDEAQQPS